MRRPFVSAALAAAALAAAPASAQYHGGRHHGWHQRGPSRHAVGELLRQLDRIDLRILRSDRRGIISPREALGLRREAAHVRGRLHRASRNGLSAREFADIRAQINRLEQHLRVERRDRDGRRG
jgi:hypothetical protein